MAYDSENGDVVIALTGDAMISRALKPHKEPEFLGVRELLHSADVRVTNGEMLFHNYENWPTSISATWMRCDPRFLADLQWLGINLVSCANNHGTDYGENGVLTNIAAYEALGLAHAGSGRNYAEAVAPTFLDTAQGRIALVAGTTSARANSRAGEQRRDINGRPGVNLLRWAYELLVDRDAFASLRRVANELGWSQNAPGWWKDAYRFVDDPSAKAVYFLDRNSHGITSEDPVARFVESDAFGRRSVIHRTDLERNLASVTEAKRMADWVIFSIHSHEGGASASEPAEHVIDLAHAVIDAGADVVFGHGPHRDRGIEIYRGKPICYSLGSLVVENDTVERLPHDALAQWGLGYENVAADLYDLRASAKEPVDLAHPGPHGQSAIAVVTFSGGELTQLRLHPLEFGYGLKRSQAGRPLLAGRNAALEALERFQKMSEPFGTKIAIEGDIGVVRVE